MGYPLASGTFPFGGWSLADALGGGFGGAVGVSRGATDSGGFDVFGSAFVASEDKFDGTATVDFGAAAGRPGQNQAVVPRKAVNIPRNTTAEAAYRAWGERLRRSRSAIASSRAAAAPCQRKCRSDQPRASTNDERTEFMARGRVRVWLPFHPGGAGFLRVPRRRLFSRLAPGRPTVPASRRRPFAADF